MEKKEVFRIDGMSCGGCAGTVQSALTQSDGVQEARVDFVEGVAEITHSLSDAEISEIVTGAGYRVSGKKE